MKDNFSHKGRFKQGSALVFSLIILSVMLLVTTGTFTASLSDQRMSNDTTKSVSSFQAADSGVEFVMNLLNANLGRTLGEAGLCNADGVGAYSNTFNGRDYKVKLLDVAGDPIDSNCASRSVRDVDSLVSAGEFGGTARAVHVELDKTVCPRVLISKDLTPGFNADSQGLMFKGNHAYIGTNSGSKAGLYIYNVTNPSNPLEESFFATNITGGVSGTAPLSCDGKISHSNAVLGIDVVGDYAYLATHNGGLVIVNVADKSNPVCQAELNIVSEAWSVQVSADGNLAYLAGYSAFYIIDVSNKSNPVFRGTLNLAGATDVGPHELDVKNGYAYIVGRDGNVHEKDGLVIVDVSNPASPSVAGKYSLPLGRSFYRGISVEGDYAYVGKTVYGATASPIGTELVTFDISDPADPRLVDSTSVAGQVWAKDVHVADGEVYFGAGSKIAVFDISANPARPNYLREADVVSPSEAQQIWKSSNGYIYVAGRANSAGTGAPLIVVKDCVD